MTHDELLRALLVERQDQTWWSTDKRAAGKHESPEDNDLICARRRRELVQAWDEREREVG